MLAGLQIALAAIIRSADTATSTSAMSAGRPSIAISSSLDRRIATSLGTRPPAIIAADMPARVPSSITGKTLLVPVETGIKARPAIPSPPFCLCRRPPA